MSNDRSVHELNEWTHKAEKVSKSDSVKSHYLDDDDLGDEFCERVSCDACMGCDQNGEPNGYGCGYRDAYIDKNFGRIVDYDEAYEIVNKELTQAKKDLEEAENLIKELSSMNDDHLLVARKGGTLHVLLSENEEVINEYFQSKESKKKGEG